MKQRIIDNTVIGQFEKYLIEEEKTRNTVDKYIRDVRSFSGFVNGREINKDLLIAYKKFLFENDYAVKSINSMLVALRVFFRFVEWDGLDIKLLRIHRQIFADEDTMITRDEYIRLCRAAEAKGNMRISLIMQTLCSTGIRVSELKYINSEAVYSGVAVITLKGKTRLVFIPCGLQEKLKSYIESTEKENGLIFTTRSGMPVDRYTIWREMKALSKDAGVNEKKVFPHNLRHLFAREFYNQEKDIVQLADVLGHSSIETTRIYMISTGNEHRGKIENLNLLL